ncbi:amidohydrolase [Usitatibacter palustris]|uniref:N-acetylcysteine deacetylase n=1 Tax=Usitatibacter palustris TaxID=2732487 RepID=A0A6M4HCT7_9PROT|nr:amidohydrolase [Usitatibacter palustris]QJR16548.1 N-acetylcysteine deacetylase [Usitatibacter palustris]
MNAPTSPFPFDAAVAAAANEIEPRVIAWRRDFHENPELGNREVRTAKIVADHLRALGFDEVREKVAHTGVVGILKGGRPGPVVALRADMDALPVTEEVDVPFKSKVRTEWNGMSCGVMHACGHDAHTSILMGVAEVLAKMRAQIPGTVTFLFQPAEETPPIGEEGGAKMMIEQGCLANPKVDAVFGLHITSIHTTGKIGYRSGPLMASADDFRIFVRGTQTHAAMPWRGVDPIVVGAQIVTGLQTIVSRQMNIAKEPSIVTVGVFHGGVRHNIIPDEVKMEGTIRTFNEEQREEIHVHVKRISEMIAAAGGATAKVHIHKWYDVTVNDPALTEWSVPTLTRIAGEANVGVIDKVCGAEDFSFYQKVVPGFFYFLGCTPPDKDARTAAPNHSPRFYADEDCLKVGVKTLSALALDWLSANAK